MINCPYCGKPAELVTGNSIYPNRPDLLHTFYWRCIPCDARVGCHKKGANVHGVISDGTLPVGTLADKTLRRLRNNAHKALDPLWLSGRMKRREAYAWLARELGINIVNCHIGRFDIETCKATIAIVGGRNKNENAKGISDRRTQPHRQP
jgi:hypothetical protein